MQRLMKVLHSYVTRDFQLYMSYNKLVNFIVLSSVRDF